jgi:murein DD-endopeptidase MepM/ murein hydrolase activator NlpD
MVLDLQPDIVTWHGPRGPYDHGDGLASWYRHLSRIDVAMGTLVEAGTVIGRVGGTGCSLGSHLHFAIRKGSTFVDPLDYLPPR